MQKLGHVKKIVNKINSFLSKTLLSSYCVFITNWNWKTISYRLNYDVVPIVICSHRKGTQIRLLKSNMHNASRTYHQLESMMTRSLMTYDLWANPSSNVLLLVLLCNAWSLDWLQQLGSFCCNNTCRDLTC